MKYYLVSELEGEYHIDYVLQSLVAAESLDDVFFMLYHKDINRVYTEDDVVLPKQEDFKTLQAFEQSYKYHLYQRPNVVKKMQAEHDLMVRHFKENTVELNIPCTETVQRIVQQINPLGDYPDI